jgi:hypothetical protein
MTGGACRSRAEVTVAASACSTSDGKRRQPAAAAEEDRHLMDLNLVQDAA